MGTQSGTSGRRMPRERADCPAETLDARGNEITSTKQSEQVIADLEFLRRKMSFRKGKLFQANKNVMSASAMGMHIDKAYQIFR